MGFCYLCGGDNGSGLGACEKCRSARRSNNIPEEPASRPHDGRLLRLFVPVIIFSAIVVSGITLVVLNVNLTNVRGQVWDLFDSRPRPLKIEIYIGAARVSLSTCRNSSGIFPISSSSN